VPYGAGDAATTPSKNFCFGIFRKVWLDLGEIWANLGKIWVKVIIFGQI